MKWEVVLFHFLILNEKPTERTVHGPRWSAWFKYLFKVWWWRIRSIQENISNVQENCTRFKSHFRKQTDVFQTLSKLLFHFLARLKLSSRSALHYLLHIRSKVFFLKLNPIKLNDSCWSQWEKSCNVSLKWNGKLSSLLQTVEPGRNFACRNPLNVKEEWKTLDPPGCSTPADTWSTFYVLLGHLVYNL